MNKIKELSKFFKNVFTLLFWGWPVALIIIWFQDQNSFLARLGLNILNFIPASISEHLTRQLSLAEKINGFFISFIPVAIFMLIAFLLIRLFDGYQRGAIFTLESIKSIRKIGTTMFIWAALNPLYQTLMSFVLTRNNPHGQKVIVICMGTDYFYNLITAGIIFLIAYIMQEGVKLHEEQTLTV